MGPRADDSSRKILAYRAVIEELTRLESLRRTVRQETRYQALLRRCDRLRIQVAREWTELAIDQTVEEILAQDRLALRVRLRKFVQLRLGIGVRKS